MNIQTRPGPGRPRPRAWGGDLPTAADEIERHAAHPRGVAGTASMDSRLFRMQLPRSAGGDEAETRGLRGGDRGTCPGTMASIGWKRIRRQQFPP